LDFINQLGAFAPLMALVFFFLASSLMIWRLGILENKGMEGTVLGTLVMPYCSGLSNIIFALLLGLKHGEGKLVWENCIVNNATNLTLLIGIPALISALVIIPSKNNKKAKGSKDSKKKSKSKGNDKKGGAVGEHFRINRLSLLLTLMAVIFFTGALWALSFDKVIDQSDAWVLIGLFVFWQIFQVFDIVKYNISKKHNLNLFIFVDILMILLAGYVMFESIDWLLGWVMSLGDGFFGNGGLGWLSGWLMVVPNAMMSLYYTFKKRPEIAYSSQIGDGHICIPLCIGIFALFENIRVPDFFEYGLLLIGGAAVVHLVFMMLFGRLPRVIGGLLVVSYGWFVYQGVIPG
jgi:cation:H+ antiporter